MVYGPPPPLRYHKPNGTPRFRAGHPLPDEYPNQWDDDGPKEIWGQADWRSAPELHRVGEKAYLVWVENTTVFYPDSPATQWRWAIREMTPAGTHGDAVGFSQYYTNNGFLEPDTGAYGLWLSGDHLLFAYSDGTGVWLDSFDAATLTHIGATQAGWGGVPGLSTPMQSAIVNRSVGPQRPVVIGANGYLFAELGFGTRSSWTKQADGIFWLRADAAGTPLVDFRNGMFRGGINYTYLVGDTAPVNGDTSRTSRDTGWSVRLDYLFGSGGDTPHLWALCNGSKPSTNNSSRPLIKIELFPSGEPNGTVFHEAWVARPEIPEWGAWPLYNELFFYPWEPSGDAYDADAACSSGGAWILGTFETTTTSADPGEMPPGWPRIPLFGTGAALYTRMYEIPMLMKIVSVGSKPVIKEAWPLQMDSAGGPYIRDQEFSGVPGQFYITYIGNPWPLRVFEADGEPWVSFAGANRWNSSDHYFAYLTRPTTGDVWALHIGEYPKNTSWVWDDYFRYTGTFKNDPCWPAISAKLPGLPSSFDFDTTFSGGFSSPYANAYSIPVGNGVLIVDTIDYISGDGSWLTGYPVVYKYPEGTDPLRMKQRDDSSGKVDNNAPRIGKSSASLQGKSPRLGKNDRTQKVI